MMQQKHYCGGYGKPISKGTVIHQMDNLSDISPNLPGVSLSLDASILPTHEPNQITCVKMQQETPGNSSHLLVNSRISDFRSQDSTIGFPFYFSAESDADFNLYIASDPSSYYTHTVNLSSYNPGWNYFAVLINDMVRRGTPDVNRITTIRYAVTPKDPLLNPYFLFGPLRTGEKDRARVMLMHDDGPDTIYTNGRSLYKDRGLIATMYVTTNLVGQTNYCTLQQLKDLQSDGWAMAAHGADHTNYVDLTDQQIINDYTTCDAWLKSNLPDQNNRHFAYIGGGVDQRISRIMDSSPFITSRSLKTQIKYHTANGLYGYNVLGAESITVGSGNTAADMLLLIDKAISDGHSIAIYTHGIVASDPTPQETTIEEMTILLDGIKLRKDAGKLVDVSIDEIYQYAHC